MEKTVKKVSALDFFCIGFGAIVGVGWAVSINNWMIGSGGPLPASIGYLAAMIMMIPIALTYCELVPMFPEAGGGMVYAHKAFGRTVALFSGWAAFGAFVAIIPWEAIQITSMLGYLIPGLTAGTPLYTLYGTDIYLSTILIGTAFSLLLYLLNRRGLAAAARVQKILCLLLVGSAVVAAAAALCAGGVENLRPLYEKVSQESSHHHFFGGVLAILATAPFFLSGFETIPQGVEEAGGDLKKVGKTVVLSVSMACVFYALLLFCFGAAMPWKEFIALDKPVAAVLFRHIYGGVWGNIFYWMIIIGAIAGLLTTWNGFFAASANLLMAMGRKGLIPRVFSRQNKNDVAVNGLLVCLALSLTGPFLGEGLVDTLTCFSAAAFVLSWMITAFSLVRLRYTMPDAHRPYRIPGGTTMGWFASLLAAAVFVLLLIPGNPVYMGRKSAIAFAVWMAVGIVLYMVNRTTEKVD